MTMDWLAILSAIGIPAIVSGIVMLTVNRHYQKKDKSEESREKIREDINLLKIDFDSFKEEQRKYYQEVEDKIDGSNELLEEEDGLTKVLAAALLVVIRDRIVEVYDCYSEKEYMPIYARESLNNMYKQYHALGGNGVTESLVEKLFDLPTEPPKDENKEN